ncbi:MAG: sigma-70 family RNA polymerase sigma factor [Chloroflexi bacterium]|nr:sigma-70 family RNA polymerase sigma factor [Chloroflexota bacterium]
MNLPDEPELLAQALGGSHQAYSALIGRYQQSVFAVCYRLLGQRQDAEDAAQETFVRAFRFLANYDPQRPFGPWVRQIATHVCYDWLRQRPSDPSPLWEEQDWPGVGNTVWREPEQRQIIRERQQQLWQAIHALPAHYRLVVELRHFQELSYNEIADQLNLPINTVKSHLLRARRLLLERLPDEDG